MRKQIYLALIEQLSTITDVDGIPAIKHFDLWNQNVEFIEMEKPSFFPLCFIEFLPIRWSGLGGGAQLATITIRLHIVEQWLYPTEKGSDFQSKGLEFLDLLDQVNEVLHGFDGENFGSLSRISSTTNHNHNGIMDNVEEFSVCVKDSSAVTEQAKAVRPEPKFRLKAQR